MALLVETFWIIIISSLHLHRVKKKEAVAAAEVYMEWQDEEEKAAAVAMLVEVFWIMLGGVCSVVAEQRSLSFCEWGIERGEKGGVDLDLSRLTRLMGKIY